MAHRRDDSAGGNHRVDGPVPFDLAQSVLAHPAFDLTKAAAAEEDDLAAAVIVAGVILTRI